MIRAIDPLAYALLQPFTPRRAAEMRDRVRLGHSVPEVEAVASEDCRELAERLERMGARFIADHDDEFPEELRPIPEPPIFLFAQGRISRQKDRPRVGIIGARAASEAGKEIAYVLARDLALEGCVIVSGLARGIDAEAHRGALAAGGDTVAVLGCGLDIAYPRENHDLHQRIPKQGALVTEFTLGTPPLGHHFPMRNRILAGLSDLLIVVEGTEKSGARSTVDHALDQGREVWAVPRDILHPGSALPNRLLRDGAPPVMGAADVLDALQALALTRSAAAKQCSSGGSETDRGSLADADAAVRNAWSKESTLAARILAVLEGAPVEEARLDQRLGGPPTHELSAAIFELELQGRVERRPGGLIARVLARR